MQKINELVNELVSTFVGCLDNQIWEKCVVKFYAIYPFIQMKGDYFLDGKVISFNPNVKTNFGKHASLRIGDLRKLMYDLNPEMGAWYTMIIEIENSGKFNVNYDYDNKPPFTYEPSKEKYIAEVKEYPRENSMTPSWLNEIINS